MTVLTDLVLNIFVSSQLLLCVWVLEDAKTAYSVICFCYLRDFLFWW